MFNYSVFMNEKLIDPNQVVAAIATATVTAIRIIAATTGLKPFLFLKYLNIFYNHTICHKTTLNLLQAFLNTLKK